MKKAPFSSNAANCKDGGSSRSSPRSPRSPRAPSERPLPTSHAPDAHDQGDPPGPPEDPQQARDLEAYRLVIQCVERQQNLLQQKQNNGPPTTSNELVVPAVLEEFKLFEDRGDEFARELATLYVNLVTHRKREQLPLSQLLARITFDANDYPRLGNRAVTTLRFPDARLARSVSDLYGGAVEFVKDAGRADISTTSDQEGWVSGGGGATLALYTLDIHLALQNVHNRVGGSGRAEEEEDIFFEVESFPQHILDAYTEQDGFASSSSSSSSSATTKSAQARSRLLTDLSALGAEFVNWMVPMTFVGEQLFVEDAEWDNVDFARVNVATLPFHQKLKVEWESRERRPLVEKRYCNVLEAVLGALAEAADGAESADASGTAAEMMRFLAFYLVLLIFEVGLERFFGACPKAPAFQTSKIQRDYTDAENRSWFDRANAALFGKTSQASRRDGIRDYVHRVLQRGILGEDIHDQDRENMERLDASLGVRLREGLAAMSRAISRATGDNRKNAQQEAPGGTTTAPSALSRGGCRVEAFLRELSAQREIFAEDVATAAYTVFRAEWARGGVCLLCQAGEKPKSLTAEHELTKGHRDRIQKYTDYRATALVRGHDREKRGKPVFPDNRSSAEVGTLLSSMRDRPSPTSSINSNSPRGSSGSSRNATIDQRPVRLPGESINYHDTSGSAPGARPASSTTSSLPDFIHVPRRNEYYCLICRKTKSSGRPSQVGESEVEAVAHARACPKRAEYEACLQDCGGSAAEVREVREWYCWQDKIDRVAEE